MPRASCGRRTRYARSFTPTCSTWLARTSRFRRVASRARGADLAVERLDKACCEVTPLECPAVRDRHIRDLRNVAQDSKAWIRVLCGAPRASPACQSQAPALAGVSRRRRSFLQRAPPDLPPGSLRHPAGATCGSPPGPLVRANRASRRTRRPDEARGQHERTYVCVRGVSRVLR